MTWAEGLWRAGHVSRRASSPCWVPPEPGGCGGQGVPGASPGLQTLQRTEQTQPMPRWSTRVPGPRPAPPPGHTHVHACMHTSAHTCLRGCTGLSCRGRRTPRPGQTEKCERLEPRRENRVLQGPLRLPQSWEPGEGRAAGGAGTLCPQKEVPRRRAVCALWLLSAADISCLC